jgi:hypothetical protein
MRLFILEELEERKLPNWMARVRFFHTDMSLEGLIVPFFEPNEFDVFGTDWAVYRHLKKDLLKASLPKNLKAYVQEIELEEIEPANTFENIQVGGRLSTTLKEVDLALSYFYGFDPRPHFASFPVKNINVRETISGQSVQQVLKLISPEDLTNEDIKVEFIRSHILGSEFETTLGWFGLRGELVFSDGRTFMTDSLASMDSSTLFTVIGADYQGETGWYANMQLSHQYLIDFEDEVLFFERHNVALNGELSNEFARGKVEVGTAGIYYLSDGSSYFNPYILWKLIANFEAEFGFNFFYGDEDSLLGFYNDNDEIYLKLSYAF